MRRQRPEAALTRLRPSLYPRRRCFLLPRLSPPGARGGREDPVGRALLQRLGRHPTSPLAHWRPPQQVAARVRQNRQVRLLAGRADAQIHPSHLADAGRG